MTFIVYIPRFVVFTAMASVFIEELESWPAEQRSRYIEKLRHLRPNFLKQLQDSTRTDDNDFNVLIHGDLWVNNILYRGDSSRLIDFQFAMFTSFAVDLQLFLLTSPNMDVRTNHFHTLIQVIFHFIFRFPLLRFDVELCIHLNTVFCVGHSLAFIEF